MTFCDYPRPAGLILETKLSLKNIHFACTTKIKARFKKSIETLNSNGRLFIFCLPPKAGYYSVKFVNP